MAVHVKEKHVICFLHNLMRAHAETVIFMLECHHEYRTGKDVGVKIKCKMTVLIKISTYVFSKDLAA